MFITSINKYITVLVIAVGTFEHCQEKRLSLHVIKKRATDSDDDARTIEKKTIENYGKKVCMPKS